jgi:glyoxylase-like metal-dependent hydrolase (beta-lactamase superfamily II)
MSAPPQWLSQEPGRLAALRALGVGVPKSSFVWLPIPYFLVRHPTVGLILVDTGFHPAVTSAPRQNLGGIVRFVGVRTSPEQTTPAQLRSRGIQPKDVKVVVMTHLHFDHASAVSEFPGATFVVADLEWQAAATDKRPWLRGYRTGQFDFAFDYRSVDYDRAPNIASYSTFGRTFDLFGDGSVRLCFTPGHSAGHQSVVLRLRDRDFVVAGDAIYLESHLDGAPEPARPVDRHQWRRSLRELQLFRREHPDAVIVPGHDKDFWPKLEPRYE